MIGKKDIRDYEISVWTLQDSFITVLKLSSNSEKRGDIEEPQMILKDDGENTLTFKIPMYLHSSNNIFVENPIWYNTINGNIISSLRKIKVIFNKNTKEEGIYEFIITNVEESHEGYEKYCSVSCEGLAFHELGKQGYKIALEGVDEISLAQKEWFEGSQDTPIPQGNIIYWADKIFKNTNWRYSVQMDWSSYDGILNDTYSGLHGIDYASFTTEEKNKFNSGREKAGLRRRDTIYEDEYISNWKVSNDQLIATAKEKFIEKYRMIEASESNRYNLSQTVAEMFQVFCKYKYYYDENYHIIDREVIFYNNFLKESEGIIDLTYNYDTQQLVRNMDGTDTITKMFVRPLDDEDMPSGQITIADTAANKSLDDYVLNFDYLYNIGAISQEQYDEVEIYQAKLHQLNASIIPLQEKIIELENDRSKVEAKVQTAKDSMQMATENLDNINLVNNSITGGDGVVSITNLNPQSLVLVKENNGNNYYAKLRTNGIKRETIKLYKTYDSLTNTLSDLISQFNVETDETGNINKLTNIKVSLENTTIIWAIFDYSLEDYYKKVGQYYAKKMQQEKNAAEVNQEKLDNINNQLEQKKNELNELVSQEENIIKDFECFMGPALREGNWQPEDEYSGYGTVYNEALQVNVDSKYDKNKIVSFGWDTELFDEEQDLFYYFGIQGDKHYYPCIRLTKKILSNFNTYDDFSKLSFIYTLNGTSNQGDKEYLTLGSKMTPCFINNNNYIIPVLLLIGADNVLDVQLNAMKENGHLSVININSSGEYVETLVENASGLNWIISPTDIAKKFSYKMAYPRIQINSNCVKSPQTQLYLKRENVLLENYKDFSVLNRDSKLYITLKPEIFFKIPKNFNAIYSINFVVSTAALAIYLDALQVLKENAYPKVSYEIDLMSLNTELIHNDYQRLGQIAHINDAEFKFQNTLGYISEVDLDLDHPWQDKIVIKNYKTKFEDLFSTIVAETEEMKKNSGLFNSLASMLNPYGFLNDNLIDDIANKLPVELERVVSPPEAYAQYEPFIRQELKASWEEAGKLLAAATSSVQDVHNLVINNADILAGFKENIKANLTPTDFIDDSNGRRYNPKINSTALSFKVGDIWTRADGNIYLATENSSQVNYGNMSNANKLISLNGWSLIKDGSLAQIKGAALNVDAEHGKIDLEAETNISLRSGKDVAIQANANVLVQANNKVDITGSQINIGSVSPSDNKGIKIVSSTASGANAATSYVDIKPSGIDMATAGGITMKGADGINIYSSDSSNTSAIRINKDEGIYLGTNKPLKLYSGAVDDIGTGAAVELSSSRLLLGVTGGKTGSAVDITKDYIIFGSAIVDEKDSVNTNVGTKDGAAGVKITKNSIEMAVGNVQDEGSRSYISMTGGKIHLANADREGNGALVDISQKGIIIGSAGKAADFTRYITADEAFSGNYDGARFQVYAPNFVVDANGHLYAFNADISGKIIAGAGQIGGWVIDKTKIIAGNSAVGLSSTFDTSTNGANDIMFWAGTTNKKPANASFKVYGNGAMTATNATIRGSITATSFLLDGATIPKSDIEGLENDLSKIKTDISQTDTKAERLITQITPITVYGLIGYNENNKNKTVDGITYDANGYPIYAGDSYGLILGNNQTLPMLIGSNGGIVIVNAQKTASAVVIDSTGIEIKTGGELNIGSNNFVVKNTSVNGEEVFRIGSSSNPYLQYKVGGGLTVTGSINAKSGSIGGFHIIENDSTSPMNHYYATSLYAHSQDGDSVAAADRREYEIGFKASSGPDSVAFYSVNKPLSATWAEAKSDSTKRKFAFYVLNNGKLVAQNAVIRGTIHATSLDINGEDIQSFIGGDAYVTKTSLYSDSTKGIIKGSALQETKNGKIVISGTTMELDANGNLKFESVSGINNVATLSMSDGLITLSTKSGTSTFSNSSAIKIGPSKIDISSSGTFTLDSTNLKVNTDGNGTVQVKGKIEATSGSVGGFSITSSANRGATSANGGHYYTNSLFGHSSDNNYEYEVGLKASGDPTDIAFYVFRKPVSATWQNAIDNNTYKGMFYVLNNGKLVAQNAVINGEIHATSGSFKGEVTATAFNLEGTKISSGDVDGFSTLQTKVNNMEAISATISYAISSSGTTTPGSSEWQSSIPSTTAAKPFLWTRTITTYTAGNQSVSYSISKRGADGTNGTNGTNGKYITKITPLYWLKKTTNPSQPTTSTNIYTNDRQDAWTTVVPTYPTNSSATYYRSEKQEWSDESITFTNYYIDYGLTAAVANATSASVSAAAAATSAQAFTGHGLLTDYEWNNETYPVALVNDSNKNPLLIGANNGITIAKSGSQSDGAALVLDKSGIALHGAAINITTASATETNVIALNHSGITLASSTKLTLNGAAIELNASGSSVVKINDKGITLGSEGKLVCQMKNFDLDAEGNLKLGRGFDTAFTFGIWSLQGGGALIGQSRARFQGGEFSDLGTSKGDWRTTADNQRQNTFEYTAASEITSAYNPYLKRARIVLNTNDSGFGNLDGKNYAIWVGDESSVNAPFSVRRDGVVTVSDIVFQQFYPHTIENHNSSNYNDTVLTVWPGRYDPSTEKARGRYSLAKIINLLIHDPSQLSDVWLSEDGDKLHEFGGTEQIL